MVESFFGSVTSDAAAVFVCFVLLGVGLELCKAFGLKVPALSDLWKELE